MNEWNVYLNGRHINTVFCTTDCDRDYVRSSLINHDGYDPNITVYRVKTLNQTSCGWWAK